MVYSGVSYSGSLDVFSAAWDSKWPGADPGEVLREKFPEQWVRFHSLPEAQRYAQNEEEYELLLRRHHTLLRELPGFDKLDELLVVSFSGSLTSPPVGRDDLLTSLLPKAAYWHSTAIGSEKQGGLLVACLRKSS